MTLLLLPLLLARPLLHSRRDIRHAAPPSEDVGKLTHLCYRLARTPQQELR